MSRVAFRMALLLLVFADRVSAQSDEGRAFEARVRAQIEDGAMSAADLNKEMEALAKNERLSGDEINDILDRLRQDFDRIQKIRKEQENGVIVADWRWGAVFIGYDYATTLTVQNGCRAPQTVSIRYPPTLLLTGPGSVTVPARASVEVALKLPLSQYRVPPQPFAFDPGCPIARGDLIVEHPRAGQCLAMKQTYHIGMQTHLHPPPGADKSGGGGGGKPKPKTCETFWRRGEFYPTKDHVTPESCTRELRLLAADFFDTTLAPLRSVDAAAWAWLPAPLDVARLSTDELLELKGRAQAQAQGEAR